MKIGPGMAALITGAGSGIGRAMSLALAKKGVRISVVEYSEESGLQTVRLVEEEHAKLHEDYAKPAAIFIKCDVRNPGDVYFAFAEHNRSFGRLDICINNAGINERGELLRDYSNDGSGSWRHVIDVNLVAVIDCTRLAVQAMKAGGCPGVILNIGSAAGLYPSFDGPTYSASKGGVVMFSRALGKLKKQNIRVNVICPEFLETDMTKPLTNQFIEAFDGFIPMEKFIKGAFELLEDDSKAGACLWITNRRGLEYWPSPEEKQKYLLKKEHSKKRISYLPKATSTIVPVIPKEYRKVVVHSLSNNFRLATKLVSVTFQLPVKPGHVLVKYLYAGVNASDVNFSAGRYFGSEQEASSKLPFDAGFEAVGIVVAFGEDVNIANLAVGSPIATLIYGGFSEFAQVRAGHIIPVPAATPEVVAMLTSGLTALIGLEQAGRMRSGETVLVTAAAGGTGQFAVQLAKLAGNKVVATCGGAQKALLLEKLGVDRVIDYKKENISSVLKKEFPKGIDLIYESVGGDMFQICLKSLAQFGRLVIIGMMSQYQGGEGWQPGNYPGVCERLLWKSQTLVGFFLIHHAQRWREAVDKLYELFSEGKLKVAVDPTCFHGLEAVADAVDFLHSGLSVGKVVVSIDSQAPLNKRSRL